jgi:hypothetical protein
VKTTEAGFNLRESVHQPRNILHTQRTEIISRAVSIRGCERVQWFFQFQRTAESGWDSVPDRKAEAGHLNYLVSVRDTAKSGIGCAVNRHLTYFAESITVNVGDSHRDDKVSSPPMTGVSVGATIVVRAWESHAHGEGSQSVGTFGANVTEC